MQPYVITIVGAESSGKTRLAMQLATHIQCPWIPEYAREYLSNLGRPYVKEDLEIIAARELERIDAHVRGESSDVRREMSDVRRETSCVRGESSDVSGELSDVNDILLFIQSKIKNPLLRPANPHPRATLRLPFTLPCPSAQCGAAQQPSKIQNLNSKILIIDGGMLTLRIWAQIKYQIEIPLVEKALANDVTDLYLLCSPRREWEPDPFREAPDILQRAWIYNQYLLYLGSHNVQMEIIRNDGGDVTFCWPKK